MTDITKVAIDLKYPKKRVWDISLSLNVGRDSPFDPFKDRVITRIMKKRDDYAPDGMYFAEKPPRHIPNVVNYNIIPHKARVLPDKQEDTLGPPPTRIEDEKLMDKGYVKPDYLRNVYFTKAQRFDQEGPRNHVQLHKQLNERREEVERQKKDKNPTVPKDIVQVPDFSRAPSLGKYTGREKLPPRPTTKPIERFTIFPWQRSKTAPPGDAAANSKAEAKTTEADEMDALMLWNKKHKETLAKHGLMAGGRWEHLRAKARANRASNMRCAVDFDLCSNRESPVPFQPRPKELTDKFYNNKYDVTTKETHRYADVKIGAYASRPSNATPLRDAVDKILTIDNLARFYRRQKIRERESPFVTPDYVDDDITVENGVEHPLTALDDYSLHPPSPPKTSQTRKFVGSPDLTLYADRPDEPLSAVIGDNASKRKAKAKSSLKKEGIL